MNNGSVILSCIVFAMVFIAGTGVYQQHKPKAGNSDLKIGEKWYSDPFRAPYEILDIKDGYVKWSQDQGGTNAPFIHSTDEGAFRRMYTKRVAD